MGPVPFISPSSPHNLKYSTNFNNKNIILYNINNNKLNYYL
jgi:hypothetical protein